MAMNKKTVKQSMRYWSVGRNGVVIRARTARVAARKWLRDNAAVHNLISGHELDNPGGSGDMPHECKAIRRWAGRGTSYAGRMEVREVPVEEVPKGTMGPSSPNRGAFWSGFN